MPTIDLLIKGKVQGVFFRASAQQKAVELGVKGWVKNMSDGSVAIRAAGDKQALDQLIQWCAQGPPRAQVTEVIQTEIPEEKFERFEVIRY